MRGSFKTVSVYDMNRSGSRIEGEYPYFERREEVRWNEYGVSLFHVGSVRGDLVCLPKVGRPSYM